MRTLVTISALAVIAASASAQLSVIPSASFRVGAGSSKSSVLFAGADVTLPANPVVSGRLDFDIWSNFKEDKGYAFSLSATNPVALGAYYGFGPSLTNFDRGDGYTTRIGAKAFVGARFLGYVIEADAIVSSGYAVGAITVGYRF